MAESDRGVLAWAHLCMLWSFAVAQPLFDILADSPEFFVARGNTVADILVFAFGVVLLPPTLLFIIARVAARLGAVGRWVQPLFVGLLGAAIVLQIATELVDGPAALLLIAALSAGAALGYTYARGAAVRTTLTVLSPAPLVFLLLFLVVSPVSKLVFGSGDVAEAEVSVQDGPPVVMVVLDEFSAEALMNPSGEIDRTRFPHFAALAEDGTWYRNATTVSDHTTDAVPSLLTGRFPREDALPIASDHPRSLFTMLGEDYSMANVNEAATDVCPVELCKERVRDSVQRRLRSLTKDLSIVYLHRLLPEGMTGSLPPVDRAFGDFADQGDESATSAGRDPDAAIPESAQINRRTQFSRFLEGIHGGRGKPALNFIHILLPHTVWQYLPGGQQYAIAGPEIPGLEDDGTWSRNAFLARQAQQREVLQTGFADRLVGRLMAKLRQTGIYDRALVVLVADHGISFRPGVSRRGAEGPGFPDIAGVPLFIKLPGQRDGRVDEGRATAVDVVPTIADALDVELDWEFDGRSLLSRDRGSKPVTIAAYPDLRRVQMPFNEFVRTRDAAVLFQAKLRPSTGWMPEYAIGPDPDLLGQAPSRLAAERNGPGRVELDGAQLLGSLDPDGLLLPAFITGRLTGVQPGARVAVALNGRIRALAYSYDDGGTTRVGAMVPPSAFRAGENRVDLYEVLGDGPARVLRRIPRSGGAAVSARLVERDGATVIERSGKDDVEVVDGAAAGFVDRVQAEAGSIEVVGWATDAEHRRVADEVLVFGDGQLIAAGRPTLNRPDVALNFKEPAIEVSGFRLLGASAEAPEVATPERLRVIAVVDGQAADVPLEPESFRVR